MVSGLGEETALLLSNQRAKKVISPLAPNQIYFYFPTALQNFNSLGKEGGGGCLTHVLLNFQAVICHFLVFFPTFKVDYDPCLL